MIVRFCVNFGAIWRWKDGKMTDLVKKMAQNTPFANWCCTKNKFMLHEFLFCAAWNCRECCEKIWFSQRKTPIPCHCKSQFIGFQQYSAWLIWPPLSSWWVLCDCRGLADWQNVSCGVCLPQKKAEKDCSFSASCTQSRGRTGTGCPTGVWDQRVYRFRHLGLIAVQR